MQPDDLAETQLACDSIHPNSADIEADTHRWAIERKLTEPKGEGAAAFAQARFPRLAARIFPTVPVDRVRDYARWLILLFALDDRCEYSHPQAIVDLYQRIATALARPSVTPNDHLVCAIGEEWQKLAGRMSLAWQARFVRHLDRHGQAAVWEAKLRNDRRTPPLAEFIDLRGWANGAFMWDLIEAVHACEVPHAITRTFAWRYLATCSNQITSWRNDLISLEKEKHQKHKDNYVIVLANSASCSEEKASSCIERQIACRVRDILYYEDAVLREVRTLESSQARPLTSVVHTFRTLPAAHAHWVLESGRYVIPRYCTAQTSEE
ncbi:hypothetical protein ACH4UY_37335 [Streptomyces longwoodensis]|uniref:terpene synthase family protein n=1 Tax=Streptomyces longwoodensis TaxID=68231 RepID=UPI0037979FE9